MLCSPRPQCRSETSDPNLAEENQEKKPNSSEKDSEDSEKDSEKESGEAPVMPCWLHALHITSCLCFHQAKMP